MCVCATDLSVCSAPCRPRQLGFFVDLLHSKSRSYITFVWWQTQRWTSLPTSTTAELTEQRRFKSPFWLCSSSDALPSVTCLLSYFTLRCPMSSLFFFNLRARNWSLFSSFSLLFSPSEEINAISPPREKTNTDNPPRAAGVWPRISQPF